MSLTFKKNPRRSDVRKNEKGRPLTVSGESYLHYGSYPVNLKLLSKKYFHDVISKEFNPIIRQYKLKKTIERVGWLGEGTDEIYTISLHNDTVYFTVDLQQDDNHSLRDNRVFDVDIYANTHYIFAHQKVVPDKEERAHRHLTMTIVKRLQLAVGKILNTFIRDARMAVILPIRYKTNKFIGPAEKRIEELLGLKPS
jgi:hypothetical protein